LEIKEHRAIKCCNEKSFLVRNGGHREKHTLMSAHNCTIWTKLDAAKKITVVNSALEDSSPIKTDFNCKRGRQIQKASFRNCKKSEIKSQDLVLLLIPGHRPLLRSERCKCILWSPHILLPIAKSTVQFPSKGDLLPS